MTMIFVSLDIGCSKIHDTYPGMFLAAVGFVMACLGFFMDSLSAANVRSQSPP